MTFLRTAIIAALAAAQLQFSALANTAQPTRIADLAIEVEAERPPLIPTGQLAGASSLRFAELSPDGKHMSFIQEFPLRAAIGVIPTDGDDRPVNFFLPQGFDATSVTWAGNERLLVFGVGIHTTRRYRYRVRSLFVVPLDGGEPRRLIEDPLVSSYADVLGVARDGSYVMIAHAEKPRDYDEDKPAVFRYDLGGEYESWLVQPAVRGISRWTVDDGGTVRLGMGLDGDTLKVWYRAEDGGEMRPIGSFDRNDQSGVGAALNMAGGSSRAYVLRSVGDEPVGLHLFDYASGTVVETLYQNEHWDVQDVWFREGEPLAVAYTDDAQRIVWFNEDDRTLYDELHAALGGGQLRLVVSSRSRDNGRMLIWAGDEADPGVLYLFDRAKRDLKVLTALRPALDFNHLARPRPIAYIARDGVLIRGYLTLPRGREPRDLPLIIMPHGGPFGIRDTLTYDDQVQLLANRGYAVLQPNFRGSGGYGEAFYQLGGGEVGRGMQDDLDDAMDWAVGQGLVDPARVCVVGGSYGGYAALWAVIRNPERYRCAASWAGVTDFDRILRYDRKFLSRSGHRRWRTLIEGEDDFNLRSVSPFRFGGNLNRPVLLAHGMRDTNVPFSQFQDMVEATQDAPVPPTTLALSGAGHSLIRERDERAWFNALDTFLAEHNPADQLAPSGQWVSPVDPRQQELFVPLEIPGNQQDENTGDQTPKSEDEAVAD